MTEITFQSEAPFRQESSSQVLTKVSKAELFTDGINQYLILTFSNLFIEPLLDLTISVTEIDATETTQVQHILHLRHFNCLKKSEKAMSEPLLLSSNFSYACISFLDLNFLSVCWDGFSLSNAFAFPSKAKRKVIKNPKKRILVGDTVAPPPSSLLTSTSFESKQYSKVLPTEKPIKENPLSQYVLSKFQPKKTKDYETTNEKVIVYPYVRHPKVVTWPLFVASVIIAAFVILGVILLLPGAYWSIFFTSNGGNLL